MTHTQLVFAFSFGLLAVVLSMPMALLLLRCWQVTDAPTSRSSHHQRTLRGGGLGVVAGTAATLSLGLLLPLPANISFVTSIGSDALIVALGALFFGALGFADDLVGLSARFRLAAQNILALGMAWALQPSLFGLPPSLSTALAAAWIVGFVNAFNFMDGINGISGITAAVIAGSLGHHTRTHASGVAALSAIAAGAALGFLPFNYPKARVFLGDVGSYAFGALLAGVALVAVGSGVAALVVLAPFILYLADVATTLIRRARRGANVLEAHREHTYQRLANGGLGHGRTSAFVGLITVALAISASLLTGGDVVATSAWISAVSAVLALYLLSPSLVGADIP